MADNKNPGGLTLLRFAIENQSVQTIADLEQTYLARHKMEGEIDSQEFHRRIIESINNYDGEGDFTEEAEKIYQNEQIQIKADLPLAQFLGELLKKRQFLTKKEEFLNNHLMVMVININTPERF